MKFWLSERHPGTTDTQEWWLYIRPSQHIEK
jgi:hypothetical protein